MVCPRCIKVVHDELLVLGIGVERVTLGQANIDPNGVGLSAISEMLERNGFKLLDDQDSQIVEEIKRLIIQYVRDGNDTPVKNLSTLLGKEIGRDYGYLSTLFSKTCSLTIERYHILQKIEYVKELLAYNELTASQISIKLGYSSPSHLAKQFKDIIGMTTSDFKRLMSPPRRSLDDLE